MTRYAIFLMLAASLFAEAREKTRPVSAKEAEHAAVAFANAIVKFGGFSYWEFEGLNRDRVKVLLSEQLLIAIDNVHDCVHDWAHRQPADSTGKPPGVDCCVFSASADWLPTSFVIQQIQLLSDGRRRVTIEYRYDSPKEHARWRVAAYIIRERDRYVVDDFEGAIDEPSSEHWFLRSPEHDCKDGKWISGY